MENWYGPHSSNHLGRDRLDLKVKHLINHQSVISKQSRVAEWLRRRGICIDGCAVILKGRLYYPWSKYVADETALSLLSPPQCDVEHQRSWWLNTKEFDQFFGDDESFMPLINQGWLERIPTSCVKKVYMKKDIFETGSNKSMRFPLQLNLCKPCRSLDRVFLTDLDWP